ncbi:MAG: sugar transferase [Elusimicrobia bacterium]|nr:sugar transferase [Elusimicrobiota bacterium]MDE2426599.1 sugar transferase [Elusimicrobiota bacterium]
MQWGIKRALDVVAGISALALLAPFFAVVAVVIKLTSAGPVFFWDTRVGKDGKRFLMAKFRTMREDASRAGSDRRMVPGDGRITTIGRWLRRWSADELPQLWNVLAGDMSLIGPRPLLPIHAEHLNQRQWRRLSVRPGLTGWAQVNGRNDIPWEVRIEKDLQYIDEFSLWLDFKITMKTLIVIAAGKGIYSILQQRDAL